MRKLRNLICLCLVFVFVVTGVSVTVKASSASEAPDFAPGEVIVGFEEISTSTLEALGARGGAIIKEIPTLKALVVKVKVGKEETFIQSVRSIHGFRYAERNGIVRAVYTPTDPYWSQLWNMRIIKADNAWDIEKGSSSVTVAVVDTGVAYTHPDLAANYVPGGYDWVNNDDNPWDDHYHGTHVAGTVAAVMDNSIGVVGVAQVGIWAEKVLNQNGQGSWDDLADGITHATRGGVDVISMSLGGYGYSSLVDSACTYAWNNGVLLVAAAGNDNLNIDVNKFYPACYSTVIAVSATDSNDRKASFSNYGNKIEVAAPGVSVYSTMPGNSYGSLSGTSMSTPHVSGVAALILSFNPSLTNQELRDRLHKAVDDLGSPGKDIYFGYGRINAFKGLAPTSVVIEHTYTFSIGPGGSWSTSSSLSDDIYGSHTGTGYADRFVMTTTASCHIVIHVEDGGLMGDTIALLRSATKYWSAVSPTPIHLEGNLGPGTYKFYIGYMLPNVGPFPATYEIYLTGT